MAGHGPAPKSPEDRRNATAPIRGEWQASPGIGWQHGKIPTAPRPMGEPARRAWKTWMRSWFAAHWTPDDLPGLEHAILLYDAVRKGDYARATELRQMMDSYGITIKGQQDRRWERPKVEPAPADVDDPYAHLRES